MNILKLSFKNILAKPLNSLMSILLFALSVGLIVFLTLFNHQFKKGLDNNLAGIDLVIGAKGSPLQLILNSMYHIDAPTGNIPIGEAAPFLNPNHPLFAASIPLSLGDSYGAFRIVGAPPSILSLYGADQVEGEIYKHDFDVVVGRNVAEKLHLHVGDEFFSTHGLEENPDLEHNHGAPFVVSGILPLTGTVLDQLILCTPQTIWHVHDHPAEETDSSHVQHDHDSHTHQHISANTITIDSNEVRTLTDRVIAALRANPEKDITSILIRYKNNKSIQSLNMLRNINQNTGLMASSPAWEINRLYAMMGSGAEAIRYIAILIAFVAALSIFISLFTSLSERKYEIALMRVSGASPGKIFLLLISEALWISFFGLLIGLLIGHLGMSFAGTILQKGYKYAFTGEIWLREELYIIAGAIVIGILAAIIPAIRGSRVKLHQTLAEN